MIKLLIVEVLEITKKYRPLKNVLKVILIIFLVGIITGEVPSAKLTLTSYNKNLYKTIDKEVSMATVDDGLYVPLETFYGVLTAYGPDCVGCSGRTSAGYDVSADNIYYHDKEYGNIRIIAADRKYPHGTIMRISEGDKSVLAIVLDRGGAIYTGNVDADLLVSSEKVAVKEVGKWSNAYFEVFRYGY